MMPLDFAGVERAEWPDSLRPVGCVYVARHGSRYMSGEKKLKTLRRELEKAREQGNLSAKGFEALAMIDSVQALSRGRWGELSAVGAAEERQLGAQMLLDYPTLAGGAGKVSTVSTFVPRAMMTMYDFNHALMLGNDSLEVRAASGRRFSPLLYFSPLIRPMPTGETMVSGAGLPTALRVAWTSPRPATFSVPPRGWTPSCFPAFARSCIRCSRAGRPWAFPLPMTG